MNIVQVNNTNIITSNSVLGTLVVQPSVQSILPQTVTTSNVVVPSTSISILKDVQTNTIIAGGPQGPAGISEDQMIYAKRLDVISDQLMYRGEAAVGALESTSSWRIRRIDLGVDGDVSEKWAGGNASFIHIWNDRLTLSYS